MRRYDVATVSGYATERPERAHRRWGEPGLSAHVVDTLHLYRVVATFRSEDRGVGNLRLGVTGALQKALDYADKLNREEEKAERAA